MKVNIIKKRHSVLDHGYISLENTMGDEQTIVDSARISTGNIGVSDKKRNEKLIGYLLKNRHTSPFEQVEMRFLIKMPIFVARQWLRHRTAHVNEYSLRYSEAELQFYTPSDWREQSTINHQASDTFFPKEKTNEMNADLRSTYAMIEETYKKLIAAGAGRELARIVLPLSTYTTIVWKSDLHNILHFIQLRCAPEAQYEIREYAVYIRRCVEILFPSVYRAFTALSPQNE